MPEAEAFQHEYALTQPVRHVVATALPLRSILYHAWAETDVEHARAAATAAALEIRADLGPSYRAGMNRASAVGWAARGPLGA